MAELSPPPTPPRGVLDESEPLEKYHRLMGPWLSQVRDALAALTLQQNHGALVTDPITVTAGTDGDLGAQVAITVPFTPLLVFFRAEALDASRRPTGVFLGGMATWSGTARGSEQGISVTRGPGLASGTSYSMTVVALPG